MKRFTVSGVIRPGGIVLLTVLALWWVWRAADWASAREALGSARWGLLAPSVLAILMTHVVRAARWGVLLRPVRQGVSYRARLDATFVGFALNNLLPARAGEVARGVWLSRREAVPVSAALTTIGLERVFDLAAVLASLALGLRLMAIGGAEGAAAHTLDYALNRGLLLLAVATAVLAGVIACRKVLVGRVRRMLPIQHFHRAGDIARTVVRSLDSLRSPGALASAAGWTLGLWACNALVYGAVFRAFGVAAPLGLVLVAQAVVALAVALPQAPAGIGVFEASVMAVLLGLGGVQSGAALAATIVLHAVVFLTPVVAGVVVLLASTGDWAAGGSNLIARPGDPGPPRYGAT